jgi:DNA damage-binding protein 1
VCVQNIGACAANESQAVVACGDELFVLQLGPAGAIALAAQTKLDNEVACLDISPAPAARASELVLVGMWRDMSVRVLDLTTLQERSRQVLPGEIVAHSALMACIEGQHYALVGMGDGTLHYLPLERSVATLGAPSSVTLASQPISLRSFLNDGKAHVFAASDRPCVIHSRNQKLLFGNVSLSSCIGVCPLNSPSYPHSLAVAVLGKLFFGQMNSVQKLQIRKQPLNEAPLRIAHDAGSRTFLVGVQTNCASLEAVAPICYLRLLSDQSLDHLDSLKLESTETVACVECLVLGEAKKAVFVVGTALVNPEDDEPTAGRVLFLETVDKKLALMHALPVNGAAMCVAAFQDGFLVGVNSKVLFYQTDAASSFELRFTHYGHMLVQDLHVRGDFVLVGDLMRSVSLLVWNAESGALTETASDDSPIFLAASCMLNQDMFLVAECNNLYVCQRNEAAATDEDRRRLDVTSRFHLGDQINRLLRWLWVQSPDPLMGGRWGKGRGGEGGGIASRVLWWLERALGCSHWRPNV